ncbi:MAG: glycerol-3-phosphate dehydrogenase/oxidase [Ardenticatenales bacterium]|nr:glycerol-3-phosphate dehydrogenase/oxidase [Ardenticatenales bacterium]
MLAKFSQETRAAALAALTPEQPFDLLIIGGGITGVGAARDAALRGYRVVLVDKRDFASGTSSKSTKLVHGGLRYLEHFEFALVFEALQERRVLLEQAPHLVQPQPILFPIYKGAENGFLKMTAGMWLYDTLSLFRNVRRHKMLGPGGVEKSVPGLRDENLTGAAHFYDANTHDARLTLANAQQAHAAGAALLTYCAVQDFLRDDEGALVGVRVRDELAGKDYEIHARLLLNCTGPWTDTVIQMADPSQPTRLRPTKGAHLVFSRERLPLDEALMVSAPQDNRPVFIIPWRGETIIGTTDTDYEGSFDDIPVTAEDVTYLLEVANYSFPEANLTASDVQSSWAGLRPLIQDPSAESEGATSREHEIWEAPEGLISIAGGKLTTYRIMGRQLIDVAAQKLEERVGLPERPAIDTAALPLPGAEQPLPQANPTRLPDDVWTHLVRYYGVHVYRIAERVAKDAMLGERLIEGMPYIWAELPHAVENEQCLTADDFLARRSWLIYEAPHRGREVLDEVVRRLSTLLGWDEPRCARERQRYEHELSLLVGQ